MRPQTLPLFSALVLGAAGARSPGQIAHHVWRVIDCASVAALVTRKPEVGVSAGLALSSGKE